MKSAQKFNKNVKLLDKEEEYKLIKNWQNNKNIKALNKLLSAFKLDITAPSCHPCK